MMTQVTVMSAALGLESRRNPVPRQSIANRKYRHHGRRYPVLVSIAVRSNLCFTLMSGQEQTYRSGSCLRCVQALHTTRDGGASDFTARAYSMRPQKGNLDHVVGFQRGVNPKPQMERFIPEVKSTSSLRVPGSARIPDPEPERMICDMMAGTNRCAATTVLASISIRVQHLEQALNPKP